MAVDYDTLVMQAGNPQLSERDRRFARLTNYANQTRRYAYFFLAFFLALAMEKQIAAWQPSVQDQAFTGFWLAAASFGLFYLVNLCFKCWAGDPFDQFGFDENVQQQQIAMPESVPLYKQAVIGGLAMPQEAVAARESPLASVNTLPPKAPVLAQWLLRHQQQQQQQQRSKREESISPEVLKFNPFMKSMMHRT